jgi:hypothetical protein
VRPVRRDRAAPSGGQSGRIVRFVTGIDAYQIPAVMFGLIKRMIGTPQERGSVLGTRAGYTHSGADRQPDRPIARTSGIETSDGVANRFRSCGRDILRCPHQQNHKLLATIAADNIALAHGL